MTKTYLTINMLTKITIQKRKDVSVATKPTHDIVAMNDNYEEKTIVGALWTKVSNDGNKFLSGQLSKTRTVEGKTYPGYVLLTEDEYKKLTSAPVKVPDMNVKLNDTGEATPEQLNELNSLDINGVRKHIVDDVPF